MAAAEHGGDSRRQIAVRQQAIQVEGWPGDRDGMATMSRDDAVQIGEGLAIVQPSAVRHEGCQEVQDPIRLGDKPLQDLPPVHAPSFTGTVVENLARPGRSLRWGQEAEGQELVAFELGPGLLESSPAFLVDQPGGGIGKAALGISGCGPPG